MSQLDVSTAVVECALWRNLQQQTAFRLTPFGASAPSFQKLASQPRAALEWKFDFPQNQERNVPFSPGKSAPLTFHDRAGELSNVSPYPFQLLKQMWVNDWIQTEFSSSPSGLTAATGDGSGHIQPAAQKPTYARDANQDGTLGRMCTMLRGPERQRYRFLLAAVGQISAKHTAIRERSKRSWTYTFSIFASSSFAFEPVRTDEFYLKFSSWQYRLPLRLKMERDRELYPPTSMSFFFSILFFRVGLPEAQSQLCCGQGFTAKQNFTVQVRSSCHNLRRCYRTN